MGDQLRNPDEVCVAELLARVQTRHNCGGGEAVGPLVLRPNDGVAIHEGNVFSTFAGGQSL